MLARALAGHAADYFRLVGSRELAVDVIANPASRAFLIGDESAGWRPAGIYVGKVESVELGPQYVALGAQGGVGLVLLLARVGALDYPREGEVGVLGSLREAAGEIIESAREPRIKLTQAIHAQHDQFF